MGFDAADEREQWLERVKRWLEMDLSYKGDQMDLRAEWEKLIRDAREGQ